MEVQYKYDVAFSFLAQDEAVATSLADLLQDRLKIFLYSQQQKELAGNDGEAVFGRVFGEEARLVVVLYRPGWGETPWTRIEETAIRNRAFNDGYGFVTFVPLEPPAVPKWLPRIQIWLGLERWGLKSAASVIESRAQELGSELKNIEGAEDRAARFSRELAFQKTRERFLGSEVGVDAANEEFSALCLALNEIADKISKSNSAFRFQIKQQSLWYLLIGLKLAVRINWVYHYGNSLNGSGLEVSFWDRHPPFPGVTVFREASSPLKQTKFEFDLAPGDRRVWRGQKRDYTSASLAEELIKELFDLESKRLGKE